MNYMYKLCGTALAVLFSVSVSSQIPFTKVETKNMMRKVADWQIAHPNTGHEHDDVSWTHAVLYAGMADWAELSEKEDGYGGDGEKTPEMKQIDREMSRRAAEKWENDPRRNRGPNFRWTDASRWDKD